ncbi:MAG: TIM barrel protein [Akkermansiaceae bacterium]
MSWKLHNAMWPGLVGKENGSDEPPIALDTILDLTQASESNGSSYDGVDLFLSFPHLDIDADDEEIKKLADNIAARNLKVGTCVAPIWQDTGGGSAMGDQAARKRFTDAVRKACRYTAVLRQHGVRSYGSIRIDSATPVSDWADNPAANTRLIAETFRECGRIAADHDEILVAEGEICWAGMHSWKDMLDLLEETGMPGTVGFQADLAHTYLYLLGYNAPEHALISDGYTDEAFWSAYQTMTDKLRPWTYDFHVAQNDGTVHGSGSHDKTGRHCPADDPNGKLDIARCAQHWLLENGQPRPEIKHLCWDGCMFPNKTLLQQNTWNTILSTMQQINQRTSQPIN